MSHRIVINTELNDKRAIDRALTTMKWKHHVSGARVDIEDGPGGGGFIDLQSGKFHGDSDFHSPERLAPLLQAYGEALWMNRFEDNSGFVESRTVLHDGTIRLIGQAASA